MLKFLDMCYICDTHTLYVLALGVVGYKWCLGTQQYHCDVTPFTSTTILASTDIDTGVNIEDGAEYYFTVQVSVKPSANCYFVL